MKFKKLLSLDQKISRGVLTITIVNVLSITLLLSIIRPVLINSLTQSYLTQLGDYISQDMVYTLLVQDDIATMEYIDNLQAFPWVEHIEMLAPDGPSIYTVGVSSIRPVLDDFSDDGVVKHEAGRSHLFRTLLIEYEGGSSEIGGYLHVSIDSAPIGTQVDRALIFVVVVLVVGAAGLWYLMRYLSEKATMSIRRLDDQLGRIEPDSAIGAQVDVAPDTYEIENVQSTVNLLLQRISVYQSDLESVVEQRTLDLASALESKNRSESFRRSLIMNLSHDLKTPLTANIGYLDHAIEMIEDGVLDTETIHALLEKSKKASVILSDEIRTLLQYSSTEEGSDPVQVDHFDVTELVEECLALSSQLCIASGNDVVVSHDGPKTIRTSRRLLKYIIDNLLANAHKACHNGKVSVRTEVIDQGDLLLTVHDTGIGIPASEIELIFERHFQSANSRHVGPRGLGIGLSLVRFWLDQLDGEISVESEVGVYTLFSVRIADNYLSLNSH